MAFNDSLNKYLKINEEMKRKNNKSLPREIPSAVARNEKGSRIKGDDDIRKLRDEPSFLPSGKNRLTPLEKDMYDEVVPDQVELDAELYADIRCKMTNQSTNSDVWHKFKKEYIEAWRDEAEAFRKLAKLKKLIKKHR